jgi:hypothetical protein
MRAKSSGVVCGDSETQSPLGDQSKLKLEL